MSDFYENMEERTRRFFRPCATCGRLAGLHFNDPTIPGRPFFITDHPFLAESLPTR